MKKERNVVRLILRDIDRISTYDWLNVTEKLHRLDGQQDIIIALYATEMLSEHEYNIINKHLQDVKAGLFRD